MAHAPQRPGAAGRVRTQVSRDQENACLLLQRSNGADLETHSVESNCWT